MNNPHLNPDEERLERKLELTSKVFGAGLKCSDLLYKEEKGRSFLDTLKSMTSVPSIIPIAHWSTIFSDLSKPYILKKVSSKSFFNTLTKEEFQQLSDLLYFASSYSFTFLGHIICTLCRKKETLFETSLFNDKKVLTVIYSLLDSFYDPYDMPKAIPSLEVIFKGIIHWKRHLAEVGLSDYCTNFFLLYAEKILDLDYKTFHRIRDTINCNNYELFCELVYGNWSGEEIKVLSKEQRLLYILLGLGEISYDFNFQTEGDFMQKLHHRNPFVFAPKNLFVLTMLIQYFYENAFVKTLHPKEVHSINYYWEVCGLEKFASLYSKWVDQEIKQLIPDTETKKQAKKEYIDHLGLKCSQKMLEKLVKGLIEGHKDEILGNFTPLVTSKTGEDREAIKKKLICLFTGEGINDESIKWPYNLKWNDKANSLKLLVYLLHYEGIIIDPLDDEDGALNQNDDEGISDKIRTNFRGRPVWNIVGEALGYGKDTLRNKVKIPKKSNVGLMKKLAQFWFECKKLDD